MKKDIIKSFNKAVKKATEGDPRYQAILVNEGGPKINGIAEVGINPEKFIFYNSKDQEENYYYNFNNKQIGTLNEFLIVIDGKNPENINLLYKISDNIYHSNDKLNCISLIYWEYSYYTCLVYTFYDKQTEQTITKCLIQNTVSDRIFLFNLLMNLLPQTQVKNVSKLKENITENDLF